MTGFTRLAVQSSSIPEMKAVLIYFAKIQDLPEKGVKKLELKSFSWNIAITENRFQMET